MIGVERIQTVLRTIAATAALKTGMGPVSANLIAPSDGGKTEMMLAALPPDAKVVNDFTYASLFSLLDVPKPPTFLVVPDFNIVIAHKPAVTQLAMALLLSLIAEGITEIPGIDRTVKLKAKHLRARGVRVALITGMTPDMFYAKRGHWRKTGFLRRLVPIHYTYTKLTQGKIQDAIASGEDALHYRHISYHRLKRADPRIPLPYREFVKQMSEQVTEQQLVWGGRDQDGQARKLQAHAFPFSAHKVLRQIVRAHALLAGRSVVTRTDLHALTDFVKFMRYDRPEEL